MGEMKNAHSILTGKLKKKRTLRRPKQRWEDNIRMDLRETGLGSGPVAGSCEQSNEPLASIKGWEFLN
jgi:hypothetical protein